MDILADILKEYGPTIITGLFLYYWQRGQRLRDERMQKEEQKREQEQKERDERREEIEKVNREVNNATMELTYATSLAVSEHKCNGELHRAQEAYNTAVQHRNELGQRLMQNK